MKSDRPIAVRWLGRVSYAAGLELQHAAERRLLEAASPGAETEELLLLEHPPVFTLGRNASETEILASPELLAARGIEVVRCDRGGKITYHGPGQLVGYPIVDLRPDRTDVGHYVADLEQALVETIATYGVAAGRLPGWSGVFVDTANPGNLHECLRDDGLVRKREGAALCAEPGAARPPASVKKVAAIGIHLRKWVTTHGFCWNLQPDLSVYELIVPCGIRDYGVTSMRELLGREIALEEAAERFAPNLLARIGRVAVAAAVAA